MIITDEMDQTVEQRDKTGTLDPGKFDRPGHGSISVSQFWCALSMLRIAEIGHLSSGRALITRSIDA